MALRPMLLALLSSFTAASENFTDCGAGVGMNQLTCCDQSDFNVTRDIARSTHCHGLVTSFDFKSDADCRKVFGIPDSHNVAWFIFWHERSRITDGFFHEFRAFTYRDSTNSKA